MDHLWAPWRMEYLKRKKNLEDGCVFCEKNISDGELRDVLILHKGKEAFVVMNLYPYTNGHLLISPYKHTADINEISEFCNIEIMNLVNQSTNILKKVKGADGFNFGANFGKAGGAGIEEHIHYHIVPRWVGDNNFMPVVGNTRVMVEGLQESWDKLKPEFDVISKY